LNTAMDMKGENVLIDMAMHPEEYKNYFRKIGSVIEKFFTFVQS